MAPAVNLIRRLLAIAVFAAWTAAAGAAAPAGGLEAALAAARPGEDIPVIVSYRGQAQRAFPEAVAASGAPPGQAARGRAWTEGQRERGRGAAAGSGRGHRRAQYSLAVDRECHRHARVARADPAAARRSRRAAAAPRPGADRADADGGRTAAGRVEHHHGARAGTLAARVSGRGRGDRDRRHRRRRPAPGPCRESYRGGSQQLVRRLRRARTPRDVSGHGTQVAGLALGGSAGGTSIGVAPRARWIAARISTTPATAARAPCTSRSSGCSTRMATRRPTMRRTWSTIPGPSRDAGVCNSRAAAGHRRAARPRTSPWSSPAATSVPGPIPVRVPPTTPMSSARARSMPARRSRSTAAAVLRPAMAESFRTSWRPATAC